MCEREGLIQASDLSFFGSLLNLSLEILDQNHCFVSSLSRILDFFYQYKMSAARRSSTGNAAERVNLGDAYQIYSEIVNVGKNVEGE